MKFYYSDGFHLPLPPGHRFPRHKYALLRECLFTDEIVNADDCVPSPLARPEDVLAAHAPGYVDAFETGQLDAKAMRRIGFPWSEGLVRRTRATIGGAIAAAASALEMGISGQFSGGTHHAHRDFGAGFCVYNDLAAAALWALRSRRTARVAIIDLDVHQGDGNAAILKEEENVFVFSIHGEKNFPFRKFPSDLDVALPDGTEDDIYLKALAEHLPAALEFRPDLVLYQAGVDPLTEDRLGRLALTHDGLMERDRLVLGACAQRGIPVSMAIGGGYADPIEASVTAYANTYRVAKRIHRF